MNRPIVIKGQLCCGDCHIRLTGDLNTCPCGWINPDRNRARFQKIEEESITQGKSYIGDYMEESLAYIQKMKAKHGAGYQDAVLKDIQRRNIERKKQERQERRQLREERDRRNREFMRPDTIRRIDALECMPAPSDQQGMKDYRDSLRAVQTLLPDTKNEG